MLTICTLSGSVLFRYGWKVDILLNASNAAEVSTSWRYRKNEQLVIGRRCHACMFREVRHSSGFQATGRLSGASRRSNSLAEKRAGKTGKRTSSILLRLNKHLCWWVHDPAMHRRPYGQIPVFLSTVSRERRLRDHQSSTSHAE